MKMLKFTNTLLLFVMLLVSVQGTDRYCPDTCEELGEVKSDVEDLRDFMKDLGRKLEEQFEWPPSQTGICPRGFTYVPLADSCYKIVFESHNWTSAAEKCQNFRRGSRLAAITSEAENSALKTFLASELEKNKGNAACIPRELPQFGIFLWTSGQRLIEKNCKSPFAWKLSSDTQLPMEFTGWAPGEPNCGWNLESCINIWVANNFGWNDLQCNTQICPLCEYKP